MCFCRLYFLRDLILFFPDMCPTRANKLFFQNVVLVGGECIIMWFCCSSSVLSMENHTTRMVVIVKEEQEAFIFYFVINGSRHLISSVSFNCSAHTVFSSLNQKVNVRRVLLVGWVVC